MRAVSRLINYQIVEIHERDCSAKCRPSRFEGRGDSTAFQIKISVRIVRRVICMLDVWKENQKWRNFRARFSNQFSPKFVRIRVRNKVKFDQPIKELEGGLEKIELIFFLFFSYLFSRCWSDSCHQQLNMGIIT